MHYIHESAEGDVFKVILTAIKDFANGKKANGSRLKTTSIVRASNDLVMSFPVMCSDTINSKTAMIITKALERMDVEIVRRVFAANYLEGKSGQDIIKQWHNNINQNLSMDDYLDMLDGIGSAIDNSKIGDGINKRLALGEMTVMEEIQKQNLAPKKFYEDNTFGVSLNSFEISESANDSYVTESKDKRFKRMMRDTGGNMYDDYEDSADYEDWKERSRRKREKYEKSKSDYTLHQEEDEKYRSGKNDKPHKNEKYNKTNGSENKSGKKDNTTGGKAFDKVDNVYDMDEANRRSKGIQNNIEGKGKAKAAEKANGEEKSLNQQKFDYQKQRDAESDTYRNERDRARDAKDEREWQASQLASRDMYLQKQLLDNDVRKANELQPSSIIVRFNAADIETGQYRVEQEFIAGIKARLISVPSAEIIDRVTSAIKDSHLLINWVKATTGEINFVKDFILGLDQAKLDAKNAKNSNTSSLWRFLAHRADKSTINRLKKNRSNGSAGAITTLVVTREEVNYLKGHAKINLDIPATAIKIMNKYNFMCLVIVDEAGEVANFLMDGETQYQTYHFNFLEKENNSESYRKTVDLLSRVNRG